MNECLNCKKKYHCCINPPSKGYVTVNIDEAVKIKRKTGISYKKFLAFNNLPDKLVKSSRADFLGTEAKFRAGMMINGRILRLKTKKNNECIFLKNGECSIYNIRPTICMIYPYWFRKTRKGVIELVIHHGCEYCGLLGNVKLTINKKIRLLSTAKKIIEQKKYYKKHIKEFVAREAIDL